MEAYTVCVEKKSGGHTHGIHTAVCAVPIESFLDYLAHNLYTILPQRCAVLAHVKSAAHVLSLLAGQNLPRAFWQGKPVPASPVAKLVGSLTVKGHFEFSTEFKFENSEQDVMVMIESAG